MANRLQLWCHFLNGSTRTHTMVVKAKIFTFAKRFVGELQPNNFQLNEEYLTPSNDGEFVAAAMYFGVNAGLRSFQDQFSIGSVIFGGQVARVIESKSDLFPVGKIVYGQFGWRSHTLVNPNKFSASNLYILPDFHGLPYSLGIGCLGMPGNSAYFGLLDICQPKENETVVVTTAVEISVGSIVGQIAKVKGCRVIGFAGSDEKCRWLENELGFDRAINYRKDDVVALLKSATPNGIDCFFDNAGGELRSLIIRQMNVNGRVAVCGATAEYNSNESVQISSPFKDIILKQLTVKGFVVYRYADRWMEGIEQILKWIRDGKIKYHETITEGFENLPLALIDVLHGKNVGKAVVKC